MKIIHLIILICVIAACKTKNKTADKQLPTDNATKVAEKKMMQPEDVTAAVGAILPTPNSWHLKEAKKWYDAAGENWLVLYETGSFRDKKTSMASAKISAALYLKKDTGFAEQWKMNDYITDCPVDVVCEFYENHLQITDLDKNGTAEVTMVYALSCKGDIGPNGKKLLMYEGNKKFAIRGNEVVKIQKDSVGGEMELDPSFSKAPTVFLEFARSYWLKFGYHKYQ